MEGGGKVAFTPLFISRTELLLLSCLASKIYSNDLHGIFTASCTVFRPSYKVISTARTSFSLTHAVKWHFESFAFLLPSLTAFLPCLTQNFDYFIYTITGNFDPLEWNFDHLAKICNHLFYGL